MSNADQHRVAPAWVLLPALGHALGGLCFGAVAGYQFLPYALSFEKAIALGRLLGLEFTPADMFWLPASLGASIGVAAGLVWGRVSHRRTARRIAAFQELAQKRGEQFSAHIDGELSVKLARDFSLNASISHVLRKGGPGARVVVGELAIATESGSGDDHRTRWTTQTAAYFTADARIPEFTLQPEHFAVKLLSRFSGVEDINFPSHEEFSRQYHLWAAQAQDVRRLFDGKLLEHLGHRPGLRIQSAANGVLVYRPAKQLGVEEIEGFIAEASGIFSLLEATARRPL